MHGFDTTERPGTSLNPLGWAPETSTRYLLGVACNCGTSSLVVAEAFERGDDVSCPACGASLR